MSSHCYCFPGLSLLLLPLLAVQAGRCIAYNCGVGCADNSWSVVAAIIINSRAEATQVNLMRQSQKRTDIDNQHKQSKSE